MRALHGLAECLWHLDQRDAAIYTYSEMLRLNPNDNQGARYQLAACLLETGRNDELRALLTRYEGDGTAYWNFSRALLDFREQGDSENARMALAEAIASNKNVPPYLLGHRKLPRTLPDYVGVGDENEAIAYAAEHADAWKVTPGALEWLAGQATTPPVTPVTVLDDASWQRRRVAALDVPRLTAQLEALQNEPLGTARPWLVLAELLPSAFAKPGGGEALATYRNALIATFTNVAALPSDEFHRVLAGTQNTALDAALRDVRSALREALEAAAVTT